MSTRNSGFTRVPMDLYQTREQWVVDALAEHVNLNGLRVWEPAAGEGKMVASLQACGAHVVATDVKDYGLSRLVFRGVFDFTVAGACPWINHADLIATNPPYGVQGAIAERFIAMGLERMGPRSSMAMLLPSDFNSAKTRAPYFRDCPRYLGKIVLTRRIRWFEPPPRVPGKRQPSGPSANHAWYIWGPSVWRLPIPPREVYAPSAVAA